MPFNEKSHLDTSQIQDRRGRSMGTKVAVGGGGLGILVLVVALIMGINPSDLSALVGGDQSSSYNNTSEISDLASQCQTGADANTREDCAIVGYVNSIQAYWTDELPNLGYQYSQAQTVLFSGATQGACGYASGASGPFYCPTDQNVYLDLDFFKELQTQFGAKGGPFAEAYVLAHEYGHHVQDLVGILDSSESSSSHGSQSMSVFIELQADCLAGIWAYHAVETGYLSALTDEEIAQSLDAAAAVGDDRIQSQTQGYVSPETWTHGSSDQRLAALKDGLSSGNVETCNTPGWSD